jgi:hypothetical protein
MDLIDRYLQAVKFWLPSEQKQDIVAELSEDLHSQVDDKESELGRPLSGAEVEAILKKGGSPMLMAQRYLPQRYLIGTALFPIYWFVLKVSWFCLYGPWLAIVVGFKIVASLGGWHSGAATSEMFEPFFRSLFIQAAVVTGVFASVERYHGNTGFLRDCIARKVSAVHDSNRIPRSSSIGEVAWYLMLLLWWVNVLRIPAIPDVTVAMASNLSRLYWPILILMICHGLIGAVNAFRPQWTPRRGALRGVVDVASLLMVSYLLDIWLSGGTLVSVASAKLSSVDIAAAQRAITRGWSVGLLIWIAAHYAARTVQNVRRAANKPPIPSRVLRLWGGD